MIRQTTSSFSAAKCRARVESLPPENRTPKSHGYIKEEKWFICLLETGFLNFYVADVWDCFKFVDDFGGDFLMYNIN